MMASQLSDLSLLLCWTAATYANAEVVMQVPPMEMWTCIHYVFQSTYLMQHVLERHSLIMEHGEIHIYPENVDLHIES